MAVTIKSSQEIELMRQAGKILAKVHEGLKKELKPGMSTLDIDRIGEEMIRSFGCEPSFKNYQDIRHPSVSPSMKKLYTGFRAKTESLKREIL